MMMGRGRSRLTSSGFTVRTVDIPDGDAGTFATVEAMRALANSRCAHPAIRTLATSIVGPGSSPPAQVARLRAWLAQHIRFLADPDTTELLHDPVLLSQWVCEQHVIGIDCDDVATFGAALGKAVGLPARFVVVGFFDPAAPLTHVWVELFDGDRWRELDTTRTAQGIGDDTRIRRRVIVDVATGQREERSMELVRNSRRVGVIPGARPRYARLGVDPVTIGVGVSLYKAISPYLQSSKEPDRLRQIAEAEARAMQGDAESLRFLKCRSIQYETCTIEGYAGLIGGFASESARIAAGEAYNRVVNARRSMGPGTTTVDTPLGGATVSNTTLLLVAAGAAFLLLRR